MLHSIPNALAEALRPAAELVSALGSFAAAACYARAIGAAAFHPVRGSQGRIRGLRVDDGWALTLAVFLVGTLLAASLVWALEHLGSYGLSSHAAFTAALIATLWPYASDRGAQAALVLFLLMLSASQLALEAATPEELIGGICIGIACACASRTWLTHRKPDSRAHC